MPAGKVTDARCWKALIDLHGDDPGFWQAVIASVRMHAAKLKEDHAYEHEFGKAECKECGRFVDEHVNNGRGPL